MKHLKLVGRVKVAPYLPALTEHAALFDEETWRQDHPESPHRATRSVYLRMPPEVTLESVFQSLIVEDKPAMKIEPFAKLTLEMASEVKAGGRVARVMLVELKPSSRIAAHIDQGAYAEATERYHLPIITNRGCIAYIEDESTHMLPGEIWWFDKHANHSFVNFGREPRVHMIMDVFHA